MQVLKKTNPIDLIAKSIHEIEKFLPDLKLPKQQVEIKNINNKPLVEISFFFLLEHPLWGSATIDYDSRLHFLDVNDLDREYKRDIIRLDLAKNIFCKNHKYHHLRIAYPTPVRRFQLIIE
jgi:hypothetical protein